MSSPALVLSLSFLVSFGAAPPEPGHEVSDTATMFGDDSVERVLIGPDRYSALMPVAGKPGCVQAKELKLLDAGTYDIVDSWPAINGCPAQGERMTLESDPASGRLIVVNHQLQIRAGLRVAAKTLTLVDMKTGTTVKRYQHEGEFTRALPLSEDGLLVISDTSVAVYPPERAAVLKGLKRPLHAKRYQQFEPQGTGPWVLLGEGDRLGAFNVVTGALVAFEASVLTAPFSPPVSTQTGMQLLDEATLRLQGDELTILCHGWGPTQYTYAFFSWRLAPGSVPHLIVGGTSPSLKGITENGITFSVEGSGPTKTLVLPAPRTAPWHGLLTMLLASPPERRTLLALTDADWKNEEKSNLFGFQVMTEKFYGAAEEHLESLYDWSTGALRGSRCIETWKSAAVPCTNRWKSAWRVLRAREKKPWPGVGTAAQWADTCMEALVRQDGPALSLCIPGYSLEYTLAPESQDLRYAVLSAVGETGGVPRPTRTTRPDGALRVEWKFGRTEASLMVTTVVKKGKRSPFELTSLTWSQDGEDGDQACRVRRLIESESSGEESP